MTFGDSITDGANAKAQYGDWPNQLADRLAEAKGGSILAVDNEGIGGNRILYDGAGVSALTRFDRDVLSQPGVADLIVLEGINDIGWPHMKPFPARAGSPMSGNPFADQRGECRRSHSGFQADHRPRAPTWNSCLWRNHDAV